MSAATTRQRKPGKAKESWFTIRSSKGLIHGAMAWWNRFTDDPYVKTTCGKNLLQSDRGPADITLVTCSQCRKALVDAGLGDLCKP
jgi:hypothetical protein